MGLMGAEYRPLSYRNEGSCFGCGAANATGLRMCFSSDGSSLASELSVPAHLCGWGRLVHGGVLSTICDEIMGWTAIYFLKRVVLTRSMTVDFMKPVFAGGPILAVGRVAEHGGERRARLQGEIFNEAGDLCVRAQADFALFTREAAMNLGFLDPASVDEIFGQFMA